MNKYYTPFIEELEAAIWLNKFKEHFDIKESKEGKI